MISEYEHSMVSTATLRRCCRSRVHDDSAWASETSLLPPAIVTGTDNRTIGNCLMDVMCRYLLGMDLQKMIKACAQYEASVVIISMDGALSNKVLVHKLSAYLASILAEG